MISSHQYEAAKKMAEPTKTSDTVRKTKPSSSKYHAVSMAGLGSLINLKQIERHNTINVQFYVQKIQRLDEPIQQK